MLRQIETVSWSAYAQPEWNKPHSVPSALSKLFDASDAASCSTAYEGLLYAIGNNHAGTYYPVLLAVMPFLEQAVMDESLWPQRAALSVLDDLFASFRPEPGYESATLQGADSQEIEPVFRQRARALRESLASIARGDSSNARIAEELLELLNDDVA